MTTPIADTPHAATRRTQLNADKLKFYRERLPASAVGQLAVGGTYAAICGVEGLTGGLVPWLAALYLVTFARVLSMLVFAGGTAKRIRLAIVSHTVLVTLTGVVWGVIPLVFSSPEFPYLLSLQALIICGLISAGAIQVGWHYRSYVAFTLCCSGPAIVLMATHPEIQYRYSGVMGIVLLAFLLLYARQFNRNLVNNFRLRYSNLDLIRRLERQNERLSDLVRRAREVDREKTKFLAMASHDLRQPLHALGLMVESLKIARERPRTDGEILGAVDDTIGELRALINALLDLSLIDSGATRVAETDVDLGTLIADLIAEFEGPAAARGLTLAMVPTSVTVRTDPVLLGTCLRNFVTNALQNTPQGRVLVGVRRRSDDTCAIEVWDTGVGIPERSRHLVFDEFFRGPRPAGVAEDLDRSRGSGLGLAIVKRISDRLGHAVYVRSTPGRGSVFGIVVPKAAQAQPTAASAPALVPSLPLALDGTSVLVIDDEPRVLDATCAVLKLWGAQVASASSGEQALARARHGMRFDLVLCDQHLGRGIDGLTTIHQLRELIGDELPAVLTTGDTLLATLPEPLPEGVELAVKPLGSDKLAGVIARVLDDPAAPSGPQQAGGSLAATG